MRTFSKILIAFGLTLVAASVTVGTIVYAHGVDRLIIAGMSGFAIVVFTGLIEDMS